MGARGEKRVSAGSGRIWYAFGWFWERGNKHSLSFLLSYLLFSSFHSLSLLLSAASLCPASFLLSVYLSLDLLKLFCSIHPLYVSFSFLFTTSFFISPLPVAFSSLLPLSILHFPSLFPLYLKEAIHMQLISPPIETACFSRSSLVTRVLSGACESAHNSLIATVLTEIHHLVEMTDRIGNS